MSDSELEKLVDGILEDNDGNLDGFIDYPRVLIITTIAIVTSLLVQ